MRKNFLILRTVTSCILDKGCWVFLLEKFEEYSYILSNDTWSHISNPNLKGPFPSDLSPPTYMWFFWTQTQQAKNWIQHTPFRTFSAFWHPYFCDWSHSLSRSPVLKARMLHLSLYTGHGATEVSGPVDVLSVAPISTSTQPSPVSSLSSLCQNCLLGTSWPPELHPIQSNS